MIKLRPEKLNDFLTTLPTSMGGPLPGISAGCLADWEKDSDYVPDPVPELDKVVYGPKSVVEEAASRLHEELLETYRHQDKK